jgi:hypothetical protein
LQPYPAAAAAVPQVLLLCLPPQPHHHQQQQQHGRHPAVHPCYFRSQVHYQQMMQPHLLLLSYC